MNIKESVFKKSFYVTFSQVGTSFTYLIMCTAFWCQSVCVINQFVRILRKDVSSNAKCTRIMRAEYNRIE